MTIENIIENLKNLINKEYPGLSQKGKDIILNEYFKKDINKLFIKGVS